MLVDGSNNTGHSPRRPGFVSVVVTRVSEMLILLIFVIEAQTSGESANLLSDGLVCK